MQVLDWELLPVLAEALDKAHDKPVRAHALSLDGRTLITLDEAGQICAWDIDSSSLLSSFNIPVAEVQHLAITNDRTFFFIHESDIMGDGHLHAFQWKDNDTCVNCLNLVSTVCSTHQLDQEAYIIVDGDGRVRLALKHKGQWVSVW